MLTLIKPQSSPQEIQFFEPLAVSRTWSTPPTERSDVFFTLFSGRPQNHRLMIAD
ncbi:MAG: hypothetical protein U0989_16380 [Azonexus sp.]|nr:hypothetical protein [Azonexus sp.]MDZ4316329.1 hypothetical protein [Azonexus sp.]